MKDRKQSALSRRLAKKESGSVDNSLTIQNTTIVNEVNEILSKLDQTVQKTHELSLESLNTTNKLYETTNESLSGSLANRILAIENNPPGGGIDPSDPDQPIIIYDNFLIQPNGNPTGDAVFLPYLDEVETTTLNSNGLKLRYSASETNHNGIIIARFDQNTAGPYTLTLGQNPDHTFCEFSDLGHFYLVFKSPATTDTEFRVGFIDNFGNNPTTNGIYFERLLTDANIFSVTRSASTETRTDTTIAYNTNTWYLLKIAKTQSNTVDFTVEAEFTPTPQSNTVNHTTNIPTTMLNAGLQVFADGTTNTADEDYKLDFFGLKLGSDPIPVPGGTTIQGTPLEVEVTQAGSVITVGLPDEIAIDQMDFDPTISAPVLAEGELSWDSDYKTLSMGLVNNVQMQLGQSTYKRVRNQTGSQINKGTPVYVQGSHGQSLIKVEPADASTEATAATTLGIAAMDIPATSDGWVIVFGYLRGINTGSFSSGSDEGKTIWLSTTTGAMTMIRPTAPDHGVVLGTLVKSAGGGAGSMFVRVANGQELDELHDVYINKTTIQNGDTIKWNTANNRFEQGPSGGSSNSVSTSIDFGLTYDEYSTEVVVTGQSWVTSGTNVVINPSVVQGHGHTVEDYLLEEIKCYVTSLNPGVGFTIQAYAPNSSFGIFDITVSEL